MKEFNPTELLDKQPTKIESALAEKAKDYPQLSTAERNSPIFKVDKTIDTPKEGAERKEAPKGNNIEKEVTLTFEPHIGKDYENGLNGVKLMQVGESHYCADPKDAKPSMTQDIIKDLSNPNSPHEGYKNTYTKGERSISGNFNSKHSDKEEFYNKTAFYNYVQEPISGARVAPTKEQFEKSGDAFLQTLEKTQPDVIVVWGNRLYENMTSKNSIPRPDLIVDGKTYQRCAYKLENGKEVEVLCIKHPSTALNPQEVHKAYQTLAQEVKSK